MIITLAGEGGSGKSTVAKLLAKRLGYRHYSTGDLRGDIAQQHGLTIDQLNDIGKKEAWTDKECDDKTADIGKTQDNMVFDSWLAWHFIPKSKKIFLTIDSSAAAERVFKHQRPDEAHQDTVEAVLHMMQERYENNVERYKKWYNIDITDRNHYDIVIDTTMLTPEQVVEKIVNALRK